MNEQDYERLVDRLAQKDDNAILAVAIEDVQRALANGGYVGDAIDAAAEGIFDDLISDPRWEKVEAADISDIARDAAERAYSQVRAWEED